MPLNSTQLRKLISEGVIDAPEEQVNAESIDVTLGGILLVEDTSKPTIFDPCKGGTFPYKRIDLFNQNYVLGCKEFVLAQVQERLCIPDTLCAQFHLKSSVARFGTEHLNACWIDSGFEGILTLELINLLQKSMPVLSRGMRIGQLSFEWVNKVPYADLYSTKGRYNNAVQVMCSKGVEK